MQILTIILAEVLLAALIALGVGLDRRMKRAETRIERDAECAEDRLLWAEQRINALTSLIEAVRSEAEMDDEEQNRDAASFTEAIASIMNFRAVPKAQGEAEK